MTDYTLSQGAHQTPDQGRCAMEWVAYLAGEPHSDQPVCVSPVLREFCIRLNDALPRDKRQRLRPYLARTIGTVGDGLDVERQWMCADWMIRTYVPAWLGLVPSLEVHAEALRSLPPVMAVEHVTRATESLAVARKDAAAAWAAARDAAWDAAWAAAGAAAGDAAWAAAGDAAWDAAWAAARDAARAAARDAARAAARDAARDALAPTVEALQDSLFDLLDRMLPTVPVQIPVVSDWKAVIGA